MAEQDKKTQIGTLQPRNATGPGPAVAPSPTPVPATEPPVVAGAKTSYLPPAVDPLIGMLIAGRYTISKKLGEGGMGAVYLAQHNLLEKAVALKLLHSEFARKADLVERFMQEAKSASRIRHENVIDISDFGTTPEGLVFFAMEHLKGHDLHEDIARARLAGQLLPWARSKKIFLQICSALTAAHSKGIIHRDLKPENIFLVDFLGEPDFVKLLDFGIAKLTEVNEEGRKLTKTGMLFGTPEYMSPEQARGENVDHRVDVYAMGCILFQLVTGRVPFEADNFMGVLSMHLTEPPPSIPPEVFDRIGAPRELAAVIDRALLKNRDERFATMEDLANAVRIVCGDPIVTSGDGRSNTPAPSVAAPQRTTESRQAEAKQHTTGSRQKTAWTGNLQVPMEEGIREKPKSKLPMLLAVLVILGGGAAAGIYMVTRDKGEAKPVVAEPSGSAPGSQVAAVTPPVTPPPVVVDAGVATVEAPVPAKVTIHLDSRPSGATIDVGDGRAHKTPLTFKIAGSHEPRRFSLTMNGFQEALVEIVPDQEDIKYTETLIKGAGGGTAPVVHQVPRTNPGTVSAGSAAPSTGPVTGPVTGPTTKPDPQTKPPDVKPPDITPPDVKPPDGKPPCMPDPNDPNGGCLKSFPGGPSGT